MKAINLMYLLIFPIAFVLFLAAKNTVPVRKHIKIRILTLLVLLMPFIQNVYSQWSAQTSGITTYITSVNFVNQITGWASGSSGKILKTTNGGTNWVQLTSGVSDNFNNIQFIDANTGWVSGPIGYILKTTNGGINWSSQSIGAAQGVMIFFTDVSTGYACGGGGTVLKTTNGGTNWSQQVSGITEYLTDLYFVNNNTGWICGFSGVMLTTTNGGTNWSQQSSGTGSEFFSVFFANLLTGWAAGSAGTLRKTTNGGINWSGQTSPTGEDLLSVFFISAQTGWISGSNGKMISTTNGGTNWVQQTTSTSASLNSVYCNGQNGWSCGDNGTIVNTVTGGFAVGAPVLISPSNNISGISLTPMLRWNNVPGALSYRVQLSTDSNFTTTLVNDSTITDSLYTVLNNVLQNNVRYYWRVRAKNAQGTGLYSSIWNFTTSLTGISHTGNEIPDEYKLYNNYPNPFNPATKIKFEIPAGSQNQHVKLSVFDVLGKEVKVLIDKAMQPGVYETDFSGLEFASGVYFYRITAGNYSDIKKMVLNK